MSGGAAMLTDALYLSGIVAILQTRVRVSFSRRDGKTSYGVELDKQAADSDEIKDFLGTLGTLPRPHSE
jgi:hypothetical protein